MNNNIHISVVSPVYMAEEVVGELIKRLKEVLKDYEKYEIILIDDCSRDNSYELISKQDVISLRNEKNIGQHPTIKKGVEISKGEWVVVMDCDLQDNPYDIPKLLSKAQEGYDIVYAERRERKDSIINRLSSYLFHKLYYIIKRQRTNHNVANFAIYRKGYYGRPVESGVRIATVEVLHCKRFAGRSSYSLFKRIKLAIKLLR